MPTLASDLVYGHIVESGRHLIISAGLGTSIAPVRFMRPPEVVQLTIGDGAALSQSRRDRRRAGF